MNDDDIRDLFKSFEPEISDGDDFIGRLDRKSTRLNSSHED